MGGDHELAKAEAAVAGRHLCMGKHRQAGRSETLLKPSGEISILKAAAAQANSVQMCALRYAKHGLGEDMHKAAVKAAADDMGSNTVLQVFDEGDEKRSSFDPQAGVSVDSERIRACIVTGVAAGFKRNGILRFVTYMHSAKCERGDRVKQSAAA